MQAEVVEVRRGRGCKLTTLAKRGRMRPRLLWARAVVRAMGAEENGWSAEWCVVSHGYADTFTLVTIWTRRLAAAGR